MYNFTLCNVDTDALTICKPDMSPFSKEEIVRLTEELNSLFPENISWEDDGYYPVYAVLKAKNYITYDGKKIKTKGSSIRDQKKEPILRKMLDEMIADIVHNNGKSLKDIYHSYVRQAMNPQDIKEWSQKKTVTKPILDCATNPQARKNESVVWDAIKHKQVQEGDKVYTYPCIISCTREETVLKNGKVKVKETKVVGLKLHDEYTNDADTEKLVDRVHATVQIFNNIVGKEYFTDYGLVKNKQLLEEL